MEGSNLDSSPSLWATIESILPGTESRCVQWLLADLKRNKMAAVLRAEHYETPRCCAHDYDVTVRV